MAKYRRGRINDEVLKELADILRTVKDPRVQAAFLSLTSVEVSADLKYAKVYYSFLTGDKKEIAAGLKSSAGYIRGQLSRRLNLRMTPELTFIYDDSIQNGAHIAELLSRLEITAEESEEETEQEP